MNEELAGYDFLLFQEPVFSAIPVLRTFFERPIFLVSDGSSRVPSTANVTLASHQSALLVLFIPPISANRGSCRVSPYEALEL